MSHLVDVVQVGVSLLDEFGYERRLLTHDAFRASALGDAGWMIARWLSDSEPLDADRLATSTGVPSGRVEQILVDLERSGAAYLGKQSEGWVRTLEPMFFSALDSIARDTGTLGTLDRERATYAAERAKRDAQYPDPSRSLFVTLRDPLAWWSTWWCSLSEGVPRAA